MSEVRVEQPPSVQTHRQCHTHQELWAAIRVLVQLSVQVSQVLVYAVQFSLFALVLFVIPVELLFVGQTLLLIHDGGKQTTCKKTIHNQ